jgi:hypothetical protein
MAYCQQCAKETGGPVVELKPHRTTMALKGDCERCGYVWMDRQGFCCDANCKVYHPEFQPQDMRAPSGAVEIQDRCSPDQPAAPPIPTLT